MFTHQAPHATPGAGSGSNEKDGPARSRWGKRWTLTASAAGMALAVGLAMGSPLVAGAAALPPSMATSQIVATQTRPGASSGGSGSSWSDGGSFPGGSGGSSSLGQSTQSEATTASASQSTGVVLISTDLKYDDASAAGTGMVLSSDGLVLTNNHVVEGATSISVTVPSTNQTYTATVVGTDSGDDVALLQLDGASGLATITADNDTESTGQEVTAVGNAQGGGTLMAAQGTITALDSTVTTQSDGTAASETLSGMIQISADVVSGDSGGALLDDEGEVVGMTTAASSGSATTVAYAIPIENAMTVVDQIRSGNESNGVELGYPAFLGVAVSSSSQASGTDTGTSAGTGSAQGGISGGTTPLAPGTTRQNNGWGFTNGRSTGASSSVAGASVQEVFEGTPAADAGLEAGDTVTAIDGRPIADSEALSTALSAHEPGDSVTITWTDTSGASHSATVTLIDGPVA